MDREIADMVALVARSADTPGDVADIKQAQDDVVGPAGSGKHFCRTAGSVSGRLRT